MLASCGAPGVPDTSGGDNGVVDDGTNGGGTSDGGGATDGGGGNDATSGAVALTGRINPGQAAKTRPRAQSKSYPLTVVAQSDATGKVLRAETDATGEFQIDIPTDEVGNSFVVTIQGPDGRALGPVLMGAAGSDGITGLAAKHDADLGTITLPDDPTKAPITVGADANIADLADATVSARLNGDGVPVGVPSHGKGSAAVVDGKGGGQAADGDRDGLIDMLDADDDGNGIVDDFDGNVGVGEGLRDIRPNFFMNLKIQAEQAQTYYGGTAAQIAAALAVDTVITFECVREPTATRQITAAHVLETPGPAYLPDAEQMVPEGSGLGWAAWSSRGYAFDAATDRFQAFVRPNAVMDAGDSFTVEVTFDDGTTVQYTRMINYVFKNIPKLVQYGSAGALNNFSLTDPAANGAPSKPIPVDGAQDLVLVFNPPPDETGAYLTDLDYTFQMGYFSAADGSGINGINAAATWPTPPPGLDRTTYRVSKESLTLAADNTYTVTLPKEIFADTVQTGSGAVAVGSYKIDITAECSSGNAAIMLCFVKQ
jgi:hypothetical protein